MKVPLVVNMSRKQRRIYRVLRSMGFVVNDGTGVRANYKAWSIAMRTFPQTGPKIQVAIMAAKLRGEI